MILAEIEAGDWFIGEHEATAERKRAEENLEKYILGVSKKWGRKTLEVDYSGHSFPQS